MRCVIVYTNYKTVEGHHVYCLVSRVNIFLQGKVQRITPTSFMYVSTIGSITKSIMFLLIDVIHVGICWKVYDVNGIYLVQ